MKTAILHGSLPSGAGNSVDLTKAGFGTPDCALLWFVITSSSPTEGVVVNHATFSAGYWINNGAGGIGSQRSMGLRSRNNVTSAIGSRCTNYGHCLSDANFDGTAWLNQLQAEPITDGIRISRPVGNGANRYIGAILFKGVEFAEGQEFMSGAFTTVKDVGFKPTLVMGIANDLVANDGTNDYSNFAIMSQGFASENGQVSWLTAMSHGASTSSCTGGLRGDVFIRHGWLTTNEFFIYCENFTATGFQFRGVAGNKNPQGRLFWLAIGNGDGGAVFGERSTSGTLSLGDNTGGGPTELVIGAMVDDGRNTTTPSSANVYACNVWMKNAAGEQLGLYYHDEDYQNTTDTGSAWRVSQLQAMEDGGAWTGNVTLTVDGVSGQSSINVSHNTSGTRFFGLAVKEGPSNNIFLGEDLLGGVYLGSTPVDVYHGGTKIWSK